MPLPKSPKQKLFELEQKVRLLEKQKSSLEKQFAFSDKKVILFDMMIDIAEEDYLLIRKKSLPEQSIDSKSSAKNS